MATQTIAVPSAPLQFPQSIQPQEISQTELALVLSLRGRLRQLEEQVANAESAIRQKLEQGARIEEGDHVAKLKESFRATVAWKEKAVDLAERLGLNGRAWAQNVLTHTTKSRTLTLVVE